MKSQLLKLLLLFFSVISSILTLANQHETNAKEFLGAERFHELQISNPGLIRYLVAKSEHGFALVNKVDEKSIALKSLTQIPFVHQTKDGLINVQEFVSSFLSGNINPLFIQISSDPNADNYYSLEGTTYFLLVRSNSYINSMIY